VNKIVGFRGVCNAKVVGKSMATKKYKEYISLQKLSTKTYNKNTTRRFRMETQHPLCKNPSFKINLHTSEYQNHSV
jgi:hypothetical protein